jgi:malate synthase
MVMGKAFLGAYSLKLIQTCHRRGAFAMGGMAAQIPVKGDEAANEAAFAKVRADKEREAGAGHDGTWVAHPDLVPVAMEVFDRLMPTPNQLGQAAWKTSGHHPASDAGTARGRAHRGRHAREHPRRRALHPGLDRGPGAVPLYNLMEDAATAEICRTQLWQWIRLSADLADGREITLAAVRQPADRGDGRPASRLRLATP